MVTIETSRGGLVVGVFEEEAPISTGMFSRVGDGMDVADAIAKVPTGNKAGHRDVRLDPVTIVTVGIDD